MKKLIWIPILILMVSFSCEDQDSNRQFDLNQIEELRQEIITLSESITCNNSSEWKFTPMGSKACGGPILYIAYHQSVEKKFLDLVEQYTKLQAEYNQRNNVVSDCALVAPPRNVICEGGKPFFVY